MQEVAKQEGLALLFLSFSAFCLPSFCLPLLRSPFLCVSVLKLPPAPPDRPFVIYTAPHRETSNPSSRMAAALAKSPWRAASFVGA